MSPDPRVSSSDRNESPPSRPVRLDEPPRPASVTHLQPHELADRWLAAIVESSTDAIISKTIEGTITSWNRAAEQIFGYAAHEIVGQPILTLIPAELQQEEPEIIARIRRGEWVEHFETRRRRKDGRVIDISLTISPIRDAKGQIVGASKIARDITARKRSELQQRLLFELMGRVNRADALDQIYDAALSAIGQVQEIDRTAIVLRDSHGTGRVEASRGLSDALKRALQQEAAWPLGTQDPEVLILNDLPGAKPSALRSAALADQVSALAFVPLQIERTVMGELVLAYAEPHVHTVDELRPIEAMARQVSFAIERQRHSLALETLVAERTASLRTAIAQMEEFSYSVSHDLRAPVRAMRGYAEAVLEDFGVSLPDEGRRMLERVCESGTRLDRLIQDILTYSRLSRRDLVLSRVDLDHLLREVIAQYPEFQPPHADVRVVSAIPPVLAHEPSLTQVVSNLLSNGVKFVLPSVRPQIQVHANAEEGAGWVRVDFIDNGIGIKPEHQTRLFDLFERIEPEGRYEGTGIGLAIVRKAMERMEGAVGVESSGEQGSRFWIRLRTA